MEVSKENSDFLLKSISADLTHGNILPLQGLIDMHRRNDMKKLLANIAIFGMSISAGLTQAQTAPAQPAPHVAGIVPLGATITEMNAIVLGWSAKKAVLGKAVMNDKKQKIGKIDDIIINPNDAVSVAIIGTGGFLGIGKHDVAIPMSQIKTDNNEFVLPGATKEALKALPAFEYQKGK